MHRLPRVSPDVPIHYANYTIPPGIPVGMSAYLMHSDPTIFPSADQFLPDRWLDDSNTTQLTAMNKSYVPFCRGSRGCLGMKYVSPLPFFHYKLFKVMILITGLWKQSSNGGNELDSSRAVPT